jgi:tRNA(fMet)-specific endonuclease VapC
LILSLDANVLIDLANQRRPFVRDRFDAALAAGHTLTTCSLAAQELLYGASISARPDVQLLTARTLFGLVRVSEFSLDDAEAAAALRAVLKAAGRPIGSIDVLIAGQALGRGWAVVTGNLREFSRVPGLEIIDWTPPTENL